jgi:hypothetical protein
MKFLSIDQHISVIADIRYIFNQLGHQVHEVSLSGHSTVIGRPAGNIPMLMGDGWCSTIHQKKFEEFYNTYKDEFKKYDGFICCYPPIFSLLYKYFEKPIIIQVPIRYECGLEHVPEQWKEFNQYLQDGIDNRMIYICANSIYDQKYTEGFINRYVNYIPSLCEYTGMSYNPTIEQFLYFGSFRVKDNSGRIIYKHDAMKAGHAWQNIGDYKGCIHYPYNISTMSTFEQYTANIPLFFPTKRYLMEMFLDNIPVLHQISWQQQGNNGTPVSKIPNNFEYDPNNFSDFNCVSHWLKYADYYTDNMHHIQYFDNVDERDEILGYTINQLLTISKQMREHNKSRKVFVYSKWQEILDRIQCL